VRGFTTQSSEIGLGVMIYIPSFIMIISDIQNLTVIVNLQTQHGDFIRLKSASLDWRVTVGGFLEQKMSPGS
jgi:hypothetical protein